MRIWGYNIRIDPKEIGIDTRNWVDLAQDSPCECGLEPPGSIRHEVGYMKELEIEYNPCKLLSKLPSDSTPLK